MDTDIRFFQLPDAGETHLSVSCCGIIDSAAIKQILLKIGELLHGVPGCCALVDLRNGSCSLKPSDIYAVIRELESDLLVTSNRIAFVSPPRIEEYDQLYMLTACLWSRGSKIEVFYDVSHALKWLSLNHVRACETRWPKTKLRPNALH